MKGRFWKVLLGAALPLVVGLTACEIGGRVATGPLRTESRNVQLGGAKNVQVHLKMGAGELSYATVRALYKPVSRQGNLIIPCDDRASMAQVPHTRSDDSAKKLTCKPEHKHNTNYR